MQAISRRLFGQVILDIFIVNLAMLLALSLRFDFKLSASLREPLRYLVWAVPLVYVSFFYLFHLYRLHWKYVGVRDTLAIVVSSICGMSTLLLLQLGTGFPNIPLSVIILHWLLTVLLVTSLRVALRMLDWEMRRQGRWHGITPRRRVLIVGAGDAGEMVAREILRLREYTLVGFVDDDPRKQNQRIHGIWVLGGTEDIAALAKKHAVYDILVALPEASGENIRRIVTLCEQASARIQVLPGLPQMLQGQARLSQFREVEIEDLLRRSPVQIDLQQVAQYLQGQRVLVTGAGGSIGSELCRQIASLQPECLILLGHGENSIYEIQQELQRLHPDLSLRAWIADIKDRRRLEFVFSESRPTVVFNAAAHKHVPLMEANTLEAIRNNVLGVRNIVEVSCDHNVRNFVFISTDKAVNPSSIMGATKRVGEIIVQCAARQCPTTNFAIVRFGNVLGSRGSVIPTLKRQIARGGPVTVTHPHMRRFFMTIPEAVRLVLQAGAMGDKGQIFVLDMGEPVKIIDLAQDLIRLSGYTPGVDMEIVYSGMRPGEKLEEELFTKHEKTDQTAHPKISVAYQNGFDVDEMMRRVDDLLRVAADYDEAQARRMLMEIGHLPTHLLPEVRDSEGETEQVAFPQR